MRTTFSLALCFLCTSVIFAQSIFKSGYSAEVGTFVSSAKRMPFWLRANQYGIVPLTAPVGTLRLGTQAEWRPDSTAKHNRWFVKYSVYAVGNITRKNQVVLPEAYAMAGLGKLYVYAGRRREISGITDTLLSSGSYAWAGNAIPITQLRIGTKDYAPLKFTKGLLAVNAFYSHGWFTDSDSMQNVYLHAKALYIRLGKPTWKVRFYGGGSHFVQWGGFSSYLPGHLADNGRIPSSWDAYAKAIWPSQIEGANSGGFTRFDTLNRSGNHLGSIDLAMEIALKKANILIYSQHPWEDQSGIDGGNIPDGLYGIRWKSRALEHSAKFRIMQWTAEFVTTMNQSGPLSETQPRGADDYFNNYQYLDGWTHQQRVIGTPFFTRWMDSNPEWYNLPAGRRRQMISNNRVKVIHLGAVGYFASGVTLKALLSQSWNYGRPLRPEPMIAFKQLSALLEATVSTSWLNGLDWRFNIALDAGEWLPTTLGGMISVRKRVGF